LQLFPPHFVFLYIFVDQQTFEDHFFLLGELQCHFFIVLHHSSSRAMPELLQEAAAL